MLWSDGEPGREPLDIQAKPLSCPADRLGEPIWAERAKVTQHLQAVWCLSLLERLRDGHGRMVPAAAGHGCGLLERPGACRCRTDLLGRGWRVAALDRRERPMRPAAPAAGSDV